MGEQNTKSIDSLKGEVTQQKAELKQKQEGREFVGAANYAKASE